MSGSNNTFDLLSMVRAQVELLCGNQNEQEPTVGLAELEKRD